MATIKTRLERGATAFDVTWKDADVVSALVREQDASVFNDIAKAVVGRKLSKRARSRPWSMTLELSREHLRDLDLDEYFAGLADVLYRSLLDVNPEDDIPESIEIAWPGSKYEGVYRSMTYTPAYDDATA
jgi:hypothetical protein